MTAAVGKNDEPFAWDTVMAVGFGLLRLSSKDFWAMTPREIERAIGFYRTGASAPPRRDELAALMAIFPDGKGG